MILKSFNKREVNLILKLLPLQLLVNGKNPGVSKKPLMLFTSLFILFKQVEGL